MIKCVPQKTEDIAGSYIHSYLVMSYITAVAKRKVFLYLLIMVGYGLQVKTKIDGLFSVINMNKQILIKNVKNNLFPVHL